MPCLLKEAAWACNLSVAGMAAQHSTRQHQTTNACAQVNDQHELTVHSSTKLPRVPFAGFTTSAVLDSAVFVNSTFGKRQQWTVDGGVHAQPLYAPGILINGQPTNMLLIVTEHATLYALNAGVSQVPEISLSHGAGRRYRYSVLASELCC